MNVLSDRPDTLAAVMERRETRGEFQRQLALDVASCMKALGTTATQSTFFRCVGATIMPDALEEVERDFLRLPDTAEELGQAAIASLWDT